MKAGEDYHFDNWKDLPSSGGFTCGYCGHDVSSNKGYTGWHKNYDNRQINEKIYFCHNCGNPTFFGMDGGQYPGPLLPEVDGISDKLISGMYDEARKAMSASAYSACIMCCRTLLAHIAVAEGADKGKRFVEYVDWLDKNGYIPKKGKGWVKTIKDRGNSAVHDIIIYEKDDAEKVMKFTEFLLKSNYEYPSYNEEPKSK